MASMAAKPASDDIKTFEKRALIELRVILQDAISSNILLNLSIQSSHKNRTRVADSSPGRDLEDLSDLKLWEVPLQPGKQHESTNTILLKFLRANEYKPLEALEMIQKTLRWRKEFGVDKLANEESEVDDFKGAMYTTGIDKEGRPVIYNVYEVFKERALNRKGYVNEETREKFMRARIQFLEKEIKQLSFKPGGIGSVLQVIDLKDSSIASMRQLRDTVKNFSSIVDDNYPELIEQHIFINVPFRYYACKAVFSQNLSQRTKNRCIFARPSRVTETLLKFIAPENIPVQYGGFHRDDEDEFTGEELTVSEMSLKPGSCSTVEFPVTEAGVTVIWDTSVVGWEVHYQEEFIPDDEGSYIVLIRKETKLEETIRSSFYISEPGRVVLTVTNPTYKRKKILYRVKSKPTVPLYNMITLPQTPSLYDSPEMGA